MIANILQGEDRFKHLSLSLSISQYNHYIQFNYSYKSHIEIKLWIHIVLIQWSKILSDNATDFFYNSTSPHIFTPLPVNAWGYTIYNFKIIHQLKHNKLTNKHLLNYSISPDQGQSGFKAMLNCHISLVTKYLRIGLVLVHFALK